MAQKVDDFLEPRSMITPGALGAIAMAATNAFCNNFSFLNAGYVGLALSFGFGLTAIVKQASFLERVVFYVLNSVIIFSVAFGTNQVGNKIQNASTTSSLAHIMTSAAYADTIGGPPAAAARVAFFNDWFPGKSGRFTLNNCGAIQDAATGNLWFVGPDQNFTWDQAEAWVKKLSACGGNWMMPTSTQMAVLFDPRSKAGTGWYERGEYWPAHLDPIFSGIGKGSWVWASGSSNDHGFPAFNFNQGISVRIKPSDPYAVRAFAVRGAKTDLPQQSPG
jgi:hypothetical protein